MSKNALGSIPTFENVARATEDLDLFNEEPKAEVKEVKEDAENKVKEDLKRQLLEQVGKRKEENQAKKPKIEAKVINSFKEIKAQEVEEQSQDKPSTKKGVRSGYKRQTFVIRDDLLELIQALSFSQDIMQVDLLEALIEKGLADIKQEVKDKALVEYRKQLNNEEQAKENIAKLFN